MKVQIEFELNSTGDLEHLIREFQELRDDHVEAKGCVKKGYCDETIHLCWVIAQLENIQSQINNKTFKYKEDE